MIDVENTLLSGYIFNARRETEGASGRILRLIRAGCKVSEGIRAKHRTTYLAKLIEDNRYANGLAQTRVAIFSPHTQLKEAPTHT